MLVVKAVVKSAWKVVSRNSFNGLFHRRARGPGAHAHLRADPFDPAPSNRVGERGSPLRTSLQPRIPCQQGN